MSGNLNTFVLLFVTESEKKALPAHFIVFHQIGKEKSYFLIKIFFQLNVFPSALAIM